MQRGYQVLVTRTVATGVILGLTASAAFAQGPALDPRQVVDPARAAEQAREQNAREQFRTFEAVLAVAVQNGGAQLAERARDVVPDVELAMRGAPLINAVPIPNVGVHFDVQVPDIQGTSLLLFDLLNPRSRRPEPVRPVGNGGVAAAGGLVQADPMVTDPSFDPNREYGTFVRESLISAMLDSSAGLPLQNGERLIVSARVPAEAEANVLAPRRRLVLQIAAEDLQAYRSGEIDRDEARQRILESRY